MGRPSVSAKALFIQHKGNSDAGAAIAQKRRSKRGPKPFAGPAMWPCAILVF